MLIVFACLVLVCLFFERYAVAVILACMAAGVALAQGTPVPGDPEIDLVLKLVDHAIATRNPVVLAPLVVMGLVWLARRFGGKRFPQLKTDRGGAVLSLVMSLAVSVGGALLMGQALSVGLVVSAAVSIITAGGYALGKKLIAPSDAPPKLELASPIDLANRRGPQP